MNWDRVRKENQSRRSGTEWIGSETLGLTTGAPLKPPRIRKADVGRTYFYKDIMPGCTCRKAVGFIGLHRKKCPLSKGHQPQSTLPAKSGPTLKQFADCIKRVGQLPATQNFLSILQKGVERDPKISKTDRQTAQQLIRALQEGLTNNLINKPEEGHRMNSSKNTSLKGLVEARLHLYLRAENQSAIKSLESITHDLKLPSYRLQCSPSMQESDLWGYRDENGKFHTTILSKAFTQGGIFCIERVEMATPDLQFWLKSGLDGAVSVAGNPSMKRHPDFLMVLTSPVPLRELWSGQVDHAFIDQLSYLDVEIDD
jgi:hypothetical protein